MSFFAPAPAPPTKLGIYRTFSPRAGVHLSPLALGAASIGDKWNEAMGAMDKEASFKLLDAYYDMGGNFIDTANFYQEESSEKFIGEWAEKRGIRDQLFIATKYTGLYKKSDPNVVQKVHYYGSNAKSLHLSVEASLKKLRTSYIDLLYVHLWDWDTSVEEVMDALHTLVLDRKVLYLGISDTPAWIVSQANTYAKAYGKTPFVVYQGQWSILDRSFERDIIPMARSLGLALAPWGVLAAGKLRTDAEEQRRLESGEEGNKIYGDWKRNENEIKVSRALEKVANELGAKSITAVAIAYVMQKTTYVFPIIGGRKVEQLKANLEGLDITLSDEQIKYLESQLPFDLGFPMRLLGDGSEPTIFMKSAANFQKMPHPKALGAPELPSN